MADIYRTVHDVVPKISFADNLKGAATGKTVLITGGGQGAGKAMAKHFALSGASTVVVAGRTESTLAAAKAELEALAPSCTVVPVATDVTRPDSVAALFAALPAPPHVLVNNSGVALNDARIADSDPDVWWNDFEVGLKGTYLCTRAYLRMLEAAAATAADGKGESEGEGKTEGGGGGGGGRLDGIVLNVSSGVCNVLSPTMSAYGSVKHAINRFTEFVQHEYGGRGVRCVAFSPGSMADTAMGRRAPPQFRHMLQDSTDLAGGFAVYLTTPAADFLAGRYVFSNWDMDELEKMRDEVVGQDLLVSRMRYGERLKDKHGPDTIMDMTGLLNQSQHSK